MKEMVYSNEYKREVLDTGYFHGFFYYILNLGTHPTAYIRIPEKHSCYEKEYDEIDIDVHGGLTFSDYELYTENNTELEGWFIGWDYMHYGDNIGTLDNGYKWTTEEIAKEVRDVCFQLAKM